VTLEQVARYADVSNFGPSGATGSAWGPDDVRRKHAALREHCTRIGRPYESVLRTFWCPLILAETEAGVQAKLDAGAGGLPWVEATRTPGMPRELRTHHQLPTPDKIPFITVASTPEEVTAYFRVLVDAGVRYVIMHRPDAETARLLAERVVPQFQVA
jgi:alkanesulfonate monooxygenase SsuD/methylene tetrahydromethanopterin reductase-like flavin-dependent oxidoreductase (luciferase family)